MNLDSCVLIAFLKNGHLQIRYAPRPGYRFPQEMGLVLAECAKKVYLELPRDERQTNLREIQRVFNEEIGPRPTPPAGKRAAQAKPRTQ